MESNKLYIYVFVREDLSEAQRIVQAVHAAVESMRGRLLPTMPHPHMVLIGVKNESRLLIEFEKFKREHQPMTLFREPMRNNEATSMCSGLIEPQNCYQFKKYNIYKGAL